jgi:hypothetical protein
MYGAKLHMKATVALLALAPRAAYQQKETLLFAVSLKALS